MSDPLSAEEIIPRSAWEWFGYPGHFIAADSCRFRLCTKVGRYLISTVGDYFDSRDVRQTLGAGSESFFETYVFEAGPPCAVEGCGCGQPALANASEIDGERCATAAEAQSLHIQYCEKYSRPGASRDD